jgi:hypothetical protein
MTGLDIEGCGAVDNLKVHRISRGVLYGKLGRRNSYTWLVSITILLY